MKQITSTKCLVRSRDDGDREAASASEDAVTTSLERTNLRFINHKLCTGIQWLYYDAIDDELHLLWWPLIENSLVKWEYIGEFY